MEYEAALEDELNTANRVLGSLGCLGLGEGLSTSPLLAVAYSAFAGGASLYSFIEDIAGETAKPKDVHSVVFRRNLEFMDPADSSKHLRIAAVLSCGILIDQDIVASIARNLSSRPAATWRVVFVDAELLETPEDLARLEQVVLHWIAPGSAGERDIQDLSRHGILFFARGPVSPLMAARVQRDRDLLAEWISTPIGKRDRLEILLLQALCLIERALAPSTAPVNDRATGSSAAPAEDVARIRQELKQRWQVRDAEALAALLQSLHLQEQRLAQGIPRLLQTLDHEGLPVSQSLGMSVAASCPMTMVGALNEAVRNHLAAWQENALDIEAQLEQGKRADLVSVGSGIDWSAVDQAVGKARNGLFYPEALFPPDMVERRLRIGGAFGLGLKAPWSPSSLAATASRAFSTSADGRQLPTDHPSVIEAFARSFVEDVFHQARAHVREIFGNQQNRNRALLDERCWELMLKLTASATRMENAACSSSAGATGFRHELTVLSETLESLVARD